MRYIKRFFSIKVIFKFVIVLIASVIFYLIFNTRLLLRVSYVDSTIISLILIILMLIMLQFIRSIILRNREISEIRMRLHQKLNGNIKKLDIISEKHKIHLIERKIQSLFSKFEKERLKEKIEYEHFKTIILSNQLSLLNQYALNGKIKTKKYKLDIGFYEDSKTIFKQRILSGEYAKRAGYESLLHLVTLYAFIASLNLFGDILNNLEISPAVILIYTIFMLLVLIVEGIFSYKAERDRLLEHYRYLQIELMKVK